MSEKKFRCGTIVPSSCVPYMGKQLTFVKPNEQLECDSTINDVFEKIDKKLAEIVNDTDYSTLNKDCLIFTPSTVKTKELIQILITDDCLAKGRLTSLETRLNNLNIGAEYITLDLGCLKEDASACEVTSNKYQLISILNLFKNKICELESTSGGGGGGPIIIANTTSVDLSGNGTTIPVSAAVNISEQAGNGLQILSDGLFVLPGTNYTDAQARAALSGSNPITYNNSSGVISISQASASNPGYLSSPDWTNFNSKVSPSRAINTGTGLSGGGDLTADRTFFVVPDTTVQRIKIRKNGTGAVISTRPQISFEENTNVTITVTDDSLNNETKIAFAAAGGGGGGGGFLTGTL